MTLRQTAYAPKSRVRTSPPAAAISSSSHYNSLRPKTAAPLAETLKLNGYSTAQFGKCHEVPVWQTSPLGFDNWPSGGGGFEHFHGSIGGETNQYAPAIYGGTTPVEPDGTPEEGYHFTEDMTDRAMDWVRQQKALMADKPFFVYLDGAKVADGRIDATVPMLFSGDETTDVGTDGGTPVSDDLDLRDSRFTGRVRWVEIDLGDDAKDADHLITPEERMRVAMARQ